MDHLELREPDRVRRHTSSAVNARVDERTSQRLASIAAGDERSLRRRLAELDDEWNVDRALMLNFVVIGGTVFAVGTRSALRRRRWNGWLSFFSVQLGFLAYHALRGWCPPVWVFRRLGFRTAREIEAERHEVAARLP